VEDSAIGMRGAELPVEIEVHKDLTRTQNLADWELRNVNIKIGLN